LNSKTNTGQYTKLTMVINYKNRTQIIQRDRLEAKINMIWRRDEILFRNKQSIGTLYRQTSAIISLLIPIYPFKRLLLFRSPPKTYKWYNCPRTRKILKGKILTESLIKCIYWTSKKKNLILVEIQCMN